MCYVVTEPVVEPYTLFTGTHWVLQSQKHLVKSWTKFCNGHTCLDEVVMFVLGVFVQLLPVRVCVSCSQVTGVMRVWC